MNAPSVQAVEAFVTMPMEYVDCTPLLRVRVKRVENAPAMEAAAVTLAARRITRQARNHGMRLLQLADAKPLFVHFRKVEAPAQPSKCRFRKLPLCTFVPTSTRSLATFLQLATRLTHLAEASNGVCDG